MAQGSIVGRHEEQMLLESLISQRLSAVIAGASGIGKTRLVREVIAAAAATGLTTVWITATQSSRDIPFGALGPLLASTALDAGSAMSPASVLRGFGVGRGSSGDLPDVVVIDDGHLLDDASATLVLQVVAAGRTSLLLTMTSRVEPPDAITALWKDGSAQRVELQPLSRDETDALVIAFLGGACDILTLERVWHVTEGNALYVREVLDAARAGGRLSQIRGLWHVDTTGDDWAPLVGLIAARIDRLDPKIRRVLEVVALAAPVPLRILESVFDLEVVAAAEEGGLIEASFDRGRAVARATHPMHAEVARALLPVTRRRSLCRQLADTMQEIGLRRHDDLLRFLTWRLEAGETAPVESLLRGAWQAAEALDMRLAERLGRAAVAVAPNHDAARLALADAVYRQARHGEALEILAASDAREDRERTEVVVARAKALWGLGRLDDAEMIVLEAASTMQDRGCLGWLQAFRATLRAALGFPMESIALAQVVVDDPTYGPRTTLSGLSSLALAFAFAGRSADCSAAVKRGTDPKLFAAAESRTLLSWIEPALWAAAWLSGDVDAAYHLAEAYRVSSLETGDSERVAGATMAIGWANLMRGEIETALAQLNDAIAIAPDDDRIGIKTIALIGASVAHAWRGETAAARAALDEAETVSRTGARWFEPCAVIGHAWIAATEGDERSARQLLEQAADDSERRGLLPYAMLALHALARLDRARAVSARLAALSKRVDGAFAQVVVAHAQALAAGDAPALAECGQRFEQLRMFLLAAECAAGEAQARVAHGDPSGAEAARTRCDTLLGRCGDARPITLERLRTPSPLTARERQIALLAASGTTTRDIAEQLHISARTVDSHLAHLYVKLGIDGRHQLDAAVGRTRDQQHD